VVRRTQIIVEREEVSIEVTGQVALDRMTHCPLCGADISHRRSPPEEKAGEVSLGQPSTNPSVKPNQHSLNTPTEPGDPQ
jgi:hypothetical protein